MSEVHVRTTFSHHVRKDWLSRWDFAIIRERADAIAVVTLRGKLFKPALMKWTVVTGRVVSQVVLHAFTEIVSGMPHLLQSWQQKGALSKLVPH